MYRVDKLIRETVIFISESTSEIVSGDYGGQSSKMIYAVFTTPRNSISANAICAFRLRDLLDTFEGAFKEQETANSNWLPVPKIKEPMPRYVYFSNKTQKMISIPHNLK